MSLARLIALLRQKLSEYRLTSTITVTVALLSLVCISFIITTIPSLVSRYFSKIIQDDQTLLATEIAENVNRVIDVRAQQFQIVVAQSPEYVQFLATTKDKKTYNVKSTESTAIAKSFRELLRQLSKINEFEVAYDAFLINNVGTIVANTEMLPESSVVNEPWWEKAKANPLSATQEVELASNGKLEIPIMVRVVDESGTFLGLVGFDLSFKEVSDVLKKYETSKEAFWLNQDTTSSERQLKLITDSNQILYSTEKIDDTQYNATISSRINAVFKRGLQSGSFIDQGDLPYEDEEQYAFSHLKNSNTNIAMSWIVVVENPVISFFTKAKNIIATNLIVLAAVAVLAIFTLIFLIRIFIVKPMNDIYTNTKKISHGDFKVHFSPPWSREFVLLNQEFEKMSSELDKNQQKINKLNSELRLVNQTLRHDIMNRLFFIGGIVGNYQKFGEKAVKLDEMLTDIRKMVDSSADFVQNMKAVEEQSVANAPLRPIDIAKIVEASKVDFEDLNITMTGNGIVLADQAVVSVIANLLQNIRVHAYNKDVSVSIAEKQDEIEVAIADQGKGIPDSIKAQLFEQGKAFGETGHTGIGLYVVKTMMQRYGGHVTVTDNLPKGTVFTLYFKRAYL
jgi:signal transduction histidine kinase